MRVCRKLLYSVAVLALMGAGIGCSSSTPDRPVQKVDVPAQSTEAVEAQFVEAVPPMVSEVGREATAQLMEELKGELQQAMKRGGAMEAVTVCSTRALAITREIAARFGTNVSLKRAALRYRNPQNKPDELETEAIHYFESLNEQDGSLPDFLFQQIQDSNGERYRTYAPIVMGNACLGCHGDESTMKPELLAEIREHYPKGTATGYKAGDFRGVIRVEIQP